MTESNNDIHDVLFKIYFCYTWAYIHVSGKGKLLYEQKETLLFRIISRYQWVV